MSSPAIRHPATAATERIQSLTNQLKGSSSNKMSTEYKFQGWLGLDKESVNGKMKWQEFEPKTWTEDDVDIKITHCGVCARYVSFCLVQRQSLTLSQ